ncbi:MAG: NUDIX hydrolase [Candidatus Saccharimonadia bacterium]
MSANSKIDYIDGHPVHFSVGAIIYKDQKLLLMSRKNPPFGLAGPAGHIDGGESPDQALAREVLEETGLRLIRSKKLFEEFVPWNECKAGIRGHYWYVFECETTGELDMSTEEAHSLNWYPVSDLNTLKLEAVWQYWFKKIGIIKED